MATGHQQCTHTYIQYHSIITSFLHAWTCMATHGILHVKCQSFLWKILFPCDKTWLFHKTRHGISTQRGQLNGICESYYYVPRECSYSQLKPVSKCPVYNPIYHIAILCNSAKVFQLLILLGKFLNTCQPYYNILE